MDKDLKEKIKERKQQAKKNNIIEKARIVTQKLGTPKQIENDDLRFDGYEYTKDRLEISTARIVAFPTYGFSGRDFYQTTICYDDKIRFDSEDNKILAYNPGRWEKELNNIYNQFKAPVKKVTFSDIESPEEELRSNWGL
ncbi:MAG: hypothetical protein Q7S27_03005 [Nanoarchaeota archaeon]|nr:hypothetical protein [Nanoarchaeota archaeon]